MSYLSEFDIYGNVLNFGNREDLEDGDDYVSWQAGAVPFEDPDGYGGHGVVVKAYNDTEERKFYVTWREIHE